MFSVVKIFGLSHVLTPHHRYVGGGPILSFSLAHGLRWIYPNNLIIYVPRSCWELEAVGVELPEEMLPKSRVPLDRVGVARLSVGRQDVNTSRKGKNDR